MSEYTPGPWKLDEYKGGRRIVVDSNPPIPIHIFRNRANALLCAAAPDLLETLKVLVDHAQEQYPHFESDRGQRDIGHALNAIARAEGKQ